MMGPPYGIDSVSEVLIRERHHAPELVDDLLDALQSKGIVNGRRGGRIQLTL
jgi:hypothetical protein